MPGTVLLGTDGPGLEFHTDQLGGEQLLLDLRTAGFRVVDRAWRSPWFESGTNVKAESCRYATLLTWVEQNVHTSGAFCAWGNSGGAAEIGFALTIWERGDLLDSAVFGGGPPVSRLDVGCKPGEVPNWATVCANPIPARVIQCAPPLCTVGTSNPVCSGCNTAPSFAGLRSESILHPAAVLEFPNTQVDLLIGTQDCSASAFGVLFFNAVESRRSLQFIPNTPHQVPRTSAGRAAIVRALLAGT